MLVVTHNPELAGHMPRRYSMIDGRMVEDGGNSSEEHHHLA
jgi:ABC-type lipoprotein export system ATPase subunit